MKKNEMKISKKYIFILLERQVNNQENIYGQRLPFINKYIRRKVGGLTVVKVVSLEWLSSEKAFTKGKILDN